MKNRCERSGMIVVPGLILVTLFLLGYTSLAFAASAVSSSLQSVNYPDRYVRHKGFLGYIDPIHSELDRNDASFVLVPGLADKRYFSFRSVNYPDHYVRHQNFEIKLHRPDGSDLFRNDATFKIVPGLYGQGGFSFESVNYPGYYLRHQHFRLYIHRMDGSELFRKDVTFMLKPGFSF